MVYEWAKDNDQEVWIEDLPSGLTLECFVSATNTQGATPLHANLNPTVAYGSFDIPAIGAAPARPATTCYRAGFEGNFLTAHATVDTLCYVIVREGANVRVFAELYVRENRAATAVG
jgi:hypothetical protein